MQGLVPTITINEHPITTQINERRRKGVVLFCGRFSNHINSTKYDCDQCNEYDTYNDYDEYNEYDEYVIIKAEPNIRVSGTRVSMYHKAGLRECGGPTNEKKRRTPKARPAFFKF